jgi:hypothetical protein
MHVQAFLADHAVDERKHDLAIQDVDVSVGGKSILLECSFDFD